jgi:MFS transporter, putative metabolite:H+ symporter
MVNDKRLFLGSCFALITTAFSFSIRAGILAKLGEQYGFSGEQLGTINSMWFLGFPISMIVGGLIYNSVGGKIIMQFAFFAHAIGILLTIFSGGSYVVLLISTLLIGLANGCTEAACNPMIADAYQGNKMNEMLNKFHVWFPGGIVLGSIISYIMTGQNFGWEAQIWVILIPAIVYAYLFWGQSFPTPKQKATDNTRGNNVLGLVSAIVGISLFALNLFPNLIPGLSLNLNYVLLAAVICLIVSTYSYYGPLFAFIFACMALTAISEFGPQSWVGLILSKSGANPMLLLAITTLTMAIARFFAGPIIHKINTTGILLISAVLACIGLFLLSRVTGYAAYASAIVYACGIAYFWPNMVGFVAEKIPSSGAMGMSVIGGIGMFSSSIFQPIIGRWIDSAKETQTAAGLTGDAMELAAGQTTLGTMVIFPAILIVAFTVLYFWQKNTVKV